ncbi:hypothetical protein HETIRDRAFT_407073 [Heterobasidion irregulare TC 32-1]|uniref:Pal1-domain-containing protein n=1 Tax=Heterobasidion irregulare (strain TC 32-1) TaxID=747525 RepID=W4KNZ6_HETIT|nr:uncharacterized protein HETIRDRAFT_407073 [Heterobasidion irregulare TC 32-1]ETW87419.1 hypothetical protein HETIRDRAFT_407073 [Heterobasidion irregulare TC 32-1]
MDAVRDTVTVRTSDHPSRSRPSRSQSTAPPTHSNPSRPLPAPARRSHSDESVPPAASADKSKANARTRTAKKPSVHADVIDRLDFSGVGPMFHHDGPFDACAPSRNRTRTKAPMYAWTGINPEDEQVAAQYRDKRSGPAAVASTTYNSPYPQRNAYNAIPTSPYYPEPPKKEVDAIAEAWGIHEPEPYEEFFAGGGNREGEAPATYGRSARRSKETRESEELRRGNKRSALPPPQPIFVADGALPENDAYPSSPPLSAVSPGIKRNKSLMQRIRKMRDSPNVPVGFDDLGTPASGNGEQSPTSSNESAGGAQYSRPTHRTQNSLLGRLGGRPGRENVSPSAEAYVYVEDPKMKELPVTPGSPHPNHDRGYFDGQPASAPGASPAGLGRKTSLLKKVKGVVKGAK